MQSLRELVSLGEDNKITEGHMIRLRNAVFEEALIGDRNYDYQIFASVMVCKDKTKREGILRVMRRIIDQPAPIAEFSKFVSLLTDYHEDLSLNTYKFLYSLISNRYLDESEIYDLAEFLTVYDVDDKDVQNELKMSVEAFIKDQLDSRKAELDLSGLIQVYYGEDGEEDISYETSDIENGLSDIADSILSDFQLDAIVRLNIQIESIIDEVDIDEIVHEYIGSQEEPDYDDYRGQVVDTDQDIDDLFERS